MSTFDPQSACSRHFTFADIIQCGETWNRFASQATPISNLPAQADTLEGIRDLAREILDPIQEKFGRVVLTYGFAGPALTKHIKRKISPPHDQHAGSEVTARGDLVCARKGQACDLRVPGVSALELGRWIRESLPFDRLYLYGSTTSLHVSHGPEQAGKVYAMVKTAGSEMPRDVGKKPWGEISRLLDRE